MLDANVIPLADATGAVPVAPDAAADNRSGVKLKRAFDSMGSVTGAETCERRHVSGSMLAAAAGLGVLVIALTFAVTAQIRVANAVPAADQLVGGGTVIVGPVTTRIAAAAPEEETLATASTALAPGDAAVASGSSTALVSAGDEEFDLLLMDADAGVAGLEALGTWRVLFDRVVGPGESLEGIAADFRTTAEAVAAYNGLPDSDSIQVGQALVIPVGFRLSLP